MGLTDDPMAPESGPSSDLGGSAPHEKRVYKSSLNIVLFPTLILCVTGWQLIRLSADGMRGNIDQAQIVLARQIGKNVESQVRGVEDVLATFAKFRDSHSEGTAQQQTVLQNLLAAYPLFERIAILSPDGVQMAGASRYAEGAASVELSDQEAFREALKRGEFVGSVMRAANGDPIASVAVRMESAQGGVSGVILAVINLVKFSARISELKVGKSGYAFVIDSRNRLVVHPEAEVLRSEEQPPEAQEGQLASKNDLEGEIGFRDEAGQEFVGAYSSILKLNWKVFINQPKKEAYAVVEGMTHRLVSAMTGILVIWVLGLFRMRRPK